MASSCKKHRADERRRKVDEMLDMFGLTGLGKRQPRELSGGQQQRVAFARALVTGQDILLMDEPLSNLDAKMRVEVRQELRELQQRAGITAVFVTHDQDEALSLSDRIAVFDKGSIRQTGTPWEVYFKPENEFVAAFVGTANFISGQVAAVEGHELVVRSEAGILRADAAGRAFQVGDAVTLVIRPECITIQPNPELGGEHANSWTGTIESSSFLGRMIRYQVRSEGLSCFVDDPSPIMRGFLDGTVRLQVDPGRIHVLHRERS